MTDHSKIDVSKLAFVASERPSAQAAFSALTTAHGQCELEDASAIIVLGGDGTLLETLRQTMHLPAPVYGMNCGTVGFLMNEYAVDNLPERLLAAEHMLINPLSMKATDKDDKVHEAMAINEIALLRETRQTARIQIKVGGQTRLEKLIC
ncbi:MAG: NAD(+)/NADH kinase, partial [Pseudomonadota bacterium]